MFNKQLEFFRISNKTKHLHHSNVQDKSDETTTRLAMRFRNGRVLSVIRGEYTYGGNKELFEAATFEVGAEYCNEPKGWLTVADVVAMAEEVASDA